MRFRFYSYGLNRAQKIESLLVSNDNTYGQVWVLTGPPIPILNYKWCQRDRRNGFLGRHMDVGNIVANRSSSSFSLCWLSPAISCTPTRSASTRLHSWVRLHVPRVPDMFAVAPGQVHQWWIFSWSKLSRGSFQSVWPKLNNRHLHFMSVLVSMSKLPTICKFPGTDSTRST